MGVAITSCILAYAIFAALHRAVPEAVPAVQHPREQRHAVGASAAGSMTGAGLVNAIPALMMLNPARCPATVARCLWLSWVLVISLARRVPRGAGQAPDDQHRAAPLPERDRRGHHAAQPCTAREAARPSARRARSGSPAPARRASSRGCATPDAPLAQVVPGTIPLPTLGARAGSSIGT